MLEIGASRTVATVRNFTRRMQRRGCPLIRINLHEADIHNPNDIELALGAKDALKKIGALLPGHKMMLPLQGIAMPRPIHTIDHIACNETAQCAGLVLRPCAQIAAGRSSARPVAAWQQWLGITGWRLGKPYPSASKSSTG